MTFIYKKNRNSTYSIFFLFLISYFLIKYTKISNIMILKQFNCKKINIYEKWVPLTTVKMVLGGP